MATYAIGDVHGCVQTLQELLSHMPAESKYLFIGDMINRGPESLETIRMIMRLGDRCTYLLGNHEMHLLAAYAGKRKQHRKDTIQSILNAPDCDEIINWVRKGKLAIYKKGFLCVHASTHWSWTLEDTLQYAHEVEKFLQSDHWQDHIDQLFGKDQWDPHAKGYDRLRGVLNVLTRTRYLNADGSMNYEAKLGLEDTDSTLIPWYQYCDRKTKDIPIIFGHWSTLGLTDWPNIFCIDTGCLWGGRLTALRLKEPVEYLSVKAPLYVSPLEV
ncbi:MAG: symmetrical bis(5'-nucleosyl)-tetraphosphatase [Burkholderiaceae bacterium]|nr:symmetrical bis(5'-nucleosyl)-tetraphosphatase [Burkholderiaceae bacterium]